MCFSFADPFVQDVYSLVAEIKGVASVVNRMEVGFKCVVGNVLKMYIFYDCIVFCWYYPSIQTQVQSKHTLD
jgi:hypothetical protein